MHTIKPDLIVHVKAKRRRDDEMTAFASSRHRLFASPNGTMAYSRAVMLRASRATPSAIRSGAECEKLRRIVLVPPPLA